MDRLPYVVSKLLTSLFVCSAVLLGPSIGLADDVDFDNMHYDSHDPMSRDNHRMTISTDSEGPLAVKYHLSNRVDDYSCQKGHVYSSFQLSNAEPEKRAFGFSRKGSPNRALYEWHLCLEVDGVRYKAWKGFDPGPGTELAVNCSLSRDQVKSRDTTKYLCSTTSIRFNKDNYRQYARYCWSEDVCTDFDTKEQYDLWTSYDPKNAAFHEVVKAQELLTTVVPFAYLNDKEAEVYKAQVLSQIEKHCADEQERTGKADACDWERQFYQREVLSNDEWRWQLTPSAFAQVFPELDGREFVDLQQLGYVFEPHWTENDQVKYYKVNCPQAGLHGREASCTLVEHHAFTAGNPNEFFNIDARSDIQTALWGYRQRKVTSVDAGEWVNKYRANNGSRPRLIAVDVDRITFSFGGEGCSYQEVFSFDPKSKKSLTFERVNGPVCH